MSCIAHRSYIPANYTSLEMIKNSNGKFEVAFSISGVTLEQFEIYKNTEFIDSMRDLAKTGMRRVPFRNVCTLLASFKDPGEFADQNKMHDDKIEMLFRSTAQSNFRNTELIYSDEITGWLHLWDLKGVLRRELSIF